MNQPDSRGGAGAGRAAAGDRRTGGYIGMLRDPAGPPPS
jgi:hypothetical protein